MSFSIPRPERVRRVRPDTKDGETSKALADVKRNDAPSVGTPIAEPIPIREGHTPAHINDQTLSRVDSPGVQNASVSSLKESLQTKETSRPEAVGQSHHTSEKESPRSPRNRDSQEAMPPPSVPSQTLSAQELRETAKQTIARPSDKTEDKVGRLTVESLSQNGSAAPSPASRQRTPSPPTRPGTRNASADSRASAGRSRSDGDHNEDKRTDRDNRQESRDRVGRREGLSHGRNGRDRASMRETDKDGKDGERDRDRDRGRDRHGDRERDRDRERERDRERDRDRDRDRDRHRRDDKDRDREGRKERDTSNRSAIATVNLDPDDRSLPSRPDLSRHRSIQNGDDGLGKRRRPTDDDVSDFVYFMITTY